MGQPWPRKSLEEVAELVGGSTPLRNVARFWGGEIPWITPTDLPMPAEGIAVISAARQTISRAGHESSGTVIIPPGTVLFSSRATIGKLGIAGVPLTTNQGFANFIPRREITSRFLAYTLWYHIGEIAQLAGSTTFKEVSRGRLRKFVISVPPLPEQERIVRLLDAAEELRRLRVAADLRTSDLIPALFNDMFGDPATNPKAWKTAPVASFVTQLQGGRSLLPTGSDDGSSRYRVLKISAVTWGDFRPQESKPVAAAYQAPYQDVVQPGDLLFSRANTSELVGATTYVYSTPPNLLLPDKLWRFVWKRPLAVEPLYVWWLFQTQAVRRELSVRATGTGGSMKNISKPKVLSLLVPLPPLALQRQFAARIAEIRALETQQAESRRRMDDLFQSMLHRAFRGEL